MRGKIKINSYIWLSLEILKEVEITKEGLVIHHHPDMRPEHNCNGLERTGTDGWKLGSHADCKTAPDWGPVWKKKKKKKSKSQSNNVEKPREKRRIDSWAEREPG